MLFGTGGGRDPGLLHWIDEVDAFAALTAAVLRDPGPGCRTEPFAGQLQAVHDNRLGRRKRKVESRSCLKR
jgi:hypothetical protein